MKDLLEQIIEKKHTKANEIFESHMSDIVESKLNEVKKMIAARMDEQVTAGHTGKVHTASGEELLPSVYRARRQLAEGKWSTKVQPGDPLKVVKAKKEMANPPLPPGKQAAKERDERRRIRRTERTEAREKRRAARMIASGASEVIGKASKTTKMPEKETGKSPRPKPVGYNDWPLIKKVRFKAKEAILRKLGLDEDIRAKAKAILEAREKKSVPPQEQDLA